MLPERILSVSYGTIPLSEESGNKPRAYEKVHSTQVTSGFPARNGSECKNFNTFWATDGLFSNKNDIHIKTSSTSISHQFI